MDREENGEGMVSVLYPFSVQRRLVTVLMVDFTRAFEVFPSQSRRSFSWQTQKQPLPPAFRFRIRKANGDQSWNRQGVVELQIGTSTYLSCFG